MWAAWNQNYSVKIFTPKNPTHKFLVVCSKGQPFYHAKINTTRKTSCIYNFFSFLFDLINIERFFFFFQHKKRGIYFFPNFRGIKGERSYSLAGATPRTRVWVVVLLSSAKSGYILHLQLIKSNQIKISLSQFLV